MKKHQNKDAKTRNQKHTYTMHSRMTPVAPRLTTTLKYAESISQNTNGAGFNVYDFNLNSLFDPNSTGTGHQPRGFDQLSALYQRYRVYRVRWEYFVQPSSSVIQARMGTMPSNAVGPSDFESIAENTYGKVRPFSSYMPIVMKGSIDLATLNGKTRVAYAADDTTQALVTASPTEILQLHCAVQDYNGVATYYGYITLWFDCEFSDPVQLAQS